MSSFIMNCKSREIGSIKYVITHVFSKFFQFISNFYFNFLFCFSKSQDLKKKEKKDIDDDDKNNKDDDDDFYDGMKMPIIPRLGANNN